MNEIAKFFTKAGVSAARSLLLSEVKGGVKSLLDRKRAKSINDIHSEMIKNIGYVTSHFSLDKKTQEIKYKPSSVFMHEWLVNSPFAGDRIVRDEETGNTYVNDEQITNAKKLDIINRFIASTNIKVASLSSHMDGALKLIDVTDFNSKKFQTSLPTWQPGQPSVIDSWLANCFNVTDTFSKTLFRKWMVGTAKRVINPGAFLDGCLTLKGPGGIGKTSLFRNLLPEAFANRANEIYCNPKNPQKFVENVIGKSICCFDELQVLDFARSTEVFKQILTTQHIDVRLAYRRDPTRFALRSGFCATTNKAQFIKDPFLSRRLWIIELNEDNKLNFDYLFANRNFLWSEAVNAANGNEDYFLSPDERIELEAKNQKYLVV